MHVRLALPTDLASVQGIEDAADRVFAEVMDVPGWGSAPTGQERVDEPGFLLTAVESADGDGLDEVVGFAHVLDLDGRAHLEQIAVLSEHARRGIGAARLEDACRYAAEQGFAQVTLRTFRDVPWNAPFYAKHGFVVLDIEPDWMAPLRETEKRVGLTPPGHPRCDGAHAALTQRRHSGASGPRIAHDRDDGQQSVAAAPRIVAPSRTVRGPSAVRAGVRRAGNGRYSGQRSTSFNDLSSEAGKEVLTPVRPDSAVPRPVDASSQAPGSDAAAAGAAPAPGVPAPSPSRTVLTASDISRALRRVAHEILEHNKGGSDLVVLGIPSRGVVLAQRLAAVMESVEGRPVPVGALDVTMHRDDLRRQPTRSPRHTDIPDGGIDDKVVVLVDDVLYSGRTVRAALDALSDLGRPRAVRLAVLVDRGHRELPIRADHVGKNLPTSSTERVSVRLTEHDGVEDQVTIAGGEAR